MATLLGFVFVRIVRYAIWGFGTGKTQVEDFLLKGPVYPVSPIRGIGLEKKAIGSCGDGESFGWLGSKGIRGKQGKNQAKEVFHGIYSEGDGSEFQALSTRTGIQVPMWGRAGRLSDRSFAEAGVDQRMA